jgi:hypothetical protein
LFSRPVRDSPFILALPAFLLSLNVYIFTIILPRAY